MPRQRTITQDKFDELLSWLDPDRSRAGARYEDIRQNLVRVFLWRGCGDPEGLADETIDRVMQKVAELRTYYVGDPVAYFYSVAKRLILEEQRRVKTHAPLEALSVSRAPASEDEEEDNERRYECLKGCLRQLSPETRELIMAYYLKEKHAKIDHRKELARRLGIEINALRVRMYRLRNALEVCITRCLAETAREEMD